MVEEFEADEGEWNLSHYPWARALKIFIPYKMLKRDKCDGQSQGLFCV